MIHVRELAKHYRVHERAPGMRSALRSLFRRTYKTVRAVDGVSFSIAAGERVGFLGPNGAGKTTTLKVLSGLLHPTSGSVEVDGHVPQRREREFLEKITLVMGQKQQLIWDLPPAETFELNRAIYGVPRARFTETMAELTELLELDDLVQRIRPEKRLVLRFERPVSGSDIAALGTVVASTELSATVRIPQDAVREVVSRALATLPVADLTVESPPLEEVMSELFARSRAEREAAQ
jgi:ABC-type uncharacterized transport system ATPase subunit